MDNADDGEVEVRALRLEQKDKPGEGDNETKQVQLPGRSDSASDHG